MKQLFTTSCLVLISNFLPAQWTVLCSGSSENNGFVVDFEYYSDNLYATGLFTRLCGANTGPLTMLQDEEWVGAGAITHEGHALEVIDDVLHVATYQFDSDSNYVFRYNGTFTSSLGEGVFCSGLDPASTPNIYDIIEYDGQIIASGDFNRVGNKDISGIMRWTGINWDSLGSGLRNSLPESPPILYAHNMHVFDGDLFVAGNFLTAGDKTVNGIARWDGAEWWEMDAGFDQAAYCVGSYSGNLYAGGQFSASGGTSLKSFARWNGSSWESPGFGFGSSAAGDFTFVHTLRVFDDKLFIIGGFDQVIMDDGTIIDCGSVIAWDGDSIYTFDGGVGDKDLEAIVPSGDGYLFGGGLFGQGYIAEWHPPITPVTVADIPTEWHLYPDPVQNILTVYNEHSTPLAYSIRNACGQLIQSGDLFSNSIPVDLLSSGMYFLTIYSENNQPTATSFIKQ
jgi:hypothetical protein